MRNTEGKVADFAIELDKSHSTTLYKELEKGKNIALLFYPSNAKYSKTCHKQMQAFNEQVEEFAKYNTSVIGVSIGGEKPRKAISDKLQLAYPIGGVNKQAFRDFGVRKTGFFWKLLDATVGKLFPQLFSKRATVIISPEGELLKKFDLPAVTNGPFMTNHAKEIAAELQKIAGVAPAKKQEAETISTYYQDKFKGQDKSSSLTVGK